jgi:hypothetical protein
MKHPPNHSSSLPISYIHTTLNTLLACTQTQFDEINEYDEILPKIDTDESLAEQFMPHFFMTIQFNSTPT